MDELLLTLLQSLEAIGEANDEIGDTECRDRMRAAVHAGFLNPVLGFRLPASFGLNGRKANQSVRKALAHYIEAARAKADELGMTFHDRLKAFQNHRITTEDGASSSEFFGYSPPEIWSASGELLE